METFRLSMVGIVKFAGVTKTNKVNQVVVQRKPNEYAYSLSVYVAENAVLPEGKSSANLLCGYSDMQLKLPKDVNAKFVYNGTDLREVDGKFEQTIAKKFVELFPGVVNCKAGQSRPEGNTLTKVVNSLCLENEDLPGSYYTVFAKDAAGRFVSPSTVKCGDEVLVDILFGINGKSINCFVQCITLLTPQKYTKINAAAKMQSEAFVEYVNSVPSSSGML